MSLFRKAFCGAYESLTAWADLLDAINVYPVADADTGANLKISLAPLRNLQINKTKLIEQLSSSAIGNSGNIAVAFLKYFLQAKSFADIPSLAQAGYENARKSVLSPKQGTMLTVFAELSNELKNPAISPNTACNHLHQPLLNAVFSTCKLIPDLKKAGVVDSGALGMFIFFDVFFQFLAKSPKNGKISCPITTLFAGKLAIADSFEKKLTGSYCVDTIINTRQSAKEYTKTISGLGESVVLVPDDSKLKVHIHTNDPANLHNKLSTIGEIIKWSDNEIDADITDVSYGKINSSIHIVTDAAGSITRQRALEFNITLLDSYIICDAECRPETLFSPADIYPKMRLAKRISTAQASTFERHQHYQNLLNQFSRVLYICVGSIYTGNYATAHDWQKANDPENRFKILDSKAASGKLGIIAMLTARYASSGKSADRVVEFAKSAINNCREYIFIDKLKFLAASGRLSKTKGVLGDFLKMKPVISPCGDGAQKVGVVKSKEGQIHFAMEKLSDEFNQKSQGFILLQYSDNKEWVVDSIKKIIIKQYPKMDIMTAPLSLTSGVHMGPGTWGIAFLPGYGRNNFG